VSKSRQSANSNLPKPKSSIGDVLFTLLENGSVSLEDYPWLQGLRTRVSELNRKHGIFLETETVKGKNRHGHTMVYNRHILPVSERDKALKLYYKISA
jgi:hypothetical protein